MRGLSPDLPVHVRLRQAMRTLIEDGLLKPGDNLPTVEEIIGSCRVSRSTASRALGELARAGVIVTRRGVRSRVARSAAPCAEVFICRGRPQLGSETERFFAQFLEGLRRGFQDPSRRIWLSYTDGHLPSSRELLDVCRARRADGLVVYGNYALLAGELVTVAAQVPTVTVGMSIAGSLADAVVADPTGALRRLLLDAHRRGKRHFAVIWRKAVLAAIGELERRFGAGPLMKSTFDATMQELGLNPIAIELVSPGLAFRDEVRQMARDLPAGCVVLGLSPGMVDFESPPEAGIEKIIFTEFSVTLDLFRRKATILYLAMDRSAQAAAELLVERIRRRGDLEQRTLRLEPEIIGPDLPSAPLPTDPVTA